ncbi:MAG: hypothetical protein PHX21_14045 [bacterium]|nr:hypothetical protein [bacterium]
MVKKTFLLLLFLSVIVLSQNACFVIGPQVASELYSNPTWFPRSDKIAYFELMRHFIPGMGSSRAIKLKLILNMKSINMPLFNKKVSWIIPQSEWDSYEMNRTHISFSPKGDKIVFSIGKNRGTIYIAEVKNNSKFQKVIDRGLNPEWSPDGKTIIYQAVDTEKQQGFFTTDDGKVSIGRIDFSHSGWKEEKKIFEIDKTESGITLLKLLIGKNPKWSSDSSKIIFSAADRIFITDKDAKSIKQVKIPFKEAGEAALSPDMSKVVFCKYRYEENLHWPEDNLYIADVNTGALIKKIIRPNNCANENASIFNPVWSPNGEYIAYNIYDCGPRSLFIIKKDGTGLKLIPISRYR